jgi:Protein of unknown function (DUF3565)
MNDFNRGIKQPITGYQLDDEEHWVAQLACGHNQHVRHDPPLVQRDWVRTPEGRKSMIGFELYCKKCIEGAPPDDRPAKIESALTQVLLEKQDRLEER